MNPFFLVTVANLMASFSCLAIASAATTRAEPQALFDSLDQNQDGQIDASEVAQPRLFARLLRTSDLNGDGQLTAAEFAEGLKPKKPEKPILDKRGSRIPGADALIVLIFKMDANGDLDVEPDEVPKELVPCFNRMLQQADSNKDSTLDRREISRVAPRLARAAIQLAKLRRFDIKQELAQIPKAKREAIYNMDKRRPLGEMLANPKEVQQLFDRMDSDNSGQLTADEVPERFVKRFQQILQLDDRNDDQQLNRKELQEYSKRLAARAKGAQAVRKLNPAQTARTVRRLLENFDQDQDGTISRSEAPPKLAAPFDRIDTNGDGKMDRLELERIAPFARQALQPQKAGKAKQKRDRDNSNR